MEPQQILIASLLAVEEMRLWGLAGAKGIVFFNELAQCLFLLIKQKLHASNPGRLPTGKNRKNNTNNDSNNTRRTKHGATTK